MKARLRLTTAADTTVFNRLVDRGQQTLAAGHPETAIEHLTGALELWQGPAMANVPPTPTVAAEAARLEQHRLTALEARIGAGSPPCPSVRPKIHIRGGGAAAALTTYSTFGYETIRLLEDSSNFYAILNAIASIGAGLGAAGCGAAIALALWN